MTERSRRRFLKESAWLGTAVLLGCTDPVRPGTSPTKEVSTAEPSRERTTISETVAEEARDQVDAGGHDQSARPDSTEVHAERSAEAMPEQAPEPVVDVGPACADPFAGGTMLGVVPFINEGGRPLDTLYGKGWDGRLYSDLSKLTAQTLLMPNDKFFVRTRYPDQLDPTQAWKIQLDGLVQSPITLTMQDLLPLKQPMGATLLECSGNSRAGHFGLLSAAIWDGIPIAQVLAKAMPKPTATRVWIRGFDKHSTPSTHSTPGASWVFSFAQLKQAGAFLATHMNGVPLPKDHGFPVRLVVPNWYGCTCIKWLDQITWVDDNALATPQMREFASRTHQRGAPRLAKDYKAAAIDHAAMPIRIERWRVQGKLKYKVVGLLWGGEAPTEKLTIRFNGREQYQPVTICPAQTTTQTWTMWSHVWEPQRRGDYRIQLQLSDNRLPKKRLDSGFYTRTVRVS